MANNSCLDTQLQFQATNPNAPADGSCNIFDPRGGGVVEQTFTNLAGLFNTAIATANFNWFGTYGHLGQEFANAVVGVGNPSNAQLLFVLRDVSVETCTAINQVLQYNKAGNYAPPIYTMYTSSTEYFAGTYSDSSTADFGFITYNAQQACVHDLYGKGDYFYVGVLLAR